MTKETQILVAEDDLQMQVALKASLERAGYETTIVPNGREAWELLEGENNYGLIISDQRMPEMGGQELLSLVRKTDDAPPFIMITAYGTITEAVQAMQLGAADFIPKPFSAEDLLRVVERTLSPEGKLLRTRSNKPRKGRPIITNNPLMIRILEVCEAVAKSDATVLIQGESGTGKELIARFIHATSPRGDRPFVAVNCAALPENLLESELFGHEKGSFTGAQAKKIGKFELAHGGTILLDEISEMAPSLQAKLLRVLQEREVDRVGGREPIAIDTRVLATTNKNLEEAVSSGSFREDLFYRLNVIPLTLPPLRERKEDIILLVKHFMGQYLGDKAYDLSSQVEETLQHYSWPGNIRELQNAVERAAILSRGREAKEADFLLSSKEFLGSEINSRARLYNSVEVERLTGSDENNSGDTSNAHLTIRSGVTVQDMEKALIMETLKSTNYNRTEASKLLGISIRTLRNKLHEYKGEAPE